MNMNTQKQGSARLAMLLGGATLLTFSGGVCAETLPAHAVIKPAIEMLTDPQLAQMRGKYLAGDQNILYFGVQMVTQWQTSTGTMNASMTLGINRASGQPVDERADIFADVDLLEIRKPSIRRDRRPIGAEQHLVLQ